MSTTILVVDDSLMVRRHVGRALTEAGFVVLEAVDGVDALQKLSANRETRLVFLDINMPRMGGIDFLKVANGAGWTVPVVMLTTERNTDQIQRATDLGAKGYIVKPYKLEHVVAVARQLTATT